MALLFKSETGPLTTAFESDSIPIACAAFPAGPAYGFMRV